MPSSEVALSALSLGRHPNTLALRVRLESSACGEHSSALYLTSGFVQPDAESAARRFAGQEEGYTYTRTSNPSVTAFERRLAALKGSQAVVGTASGMAAIEQVFYPGLSSHPQHALAMVQQSGCGGAVIAFSVKSATPEQARRRAFHVIDSTRVCSIATNLGDVKTIICHPASTSHGRLTEEQRQTAGVVQGLIRLAVGLEYPTDIQADLARGLDTCPDVH